MSFRGVQSPKRNERYLGSITVPFSEGEPGSLGYVVALETWRFFMIQFFLIRYVVFSDGWLNREFNGTQRTNEFS